MRKEIAVCRWCVLGPKDIITLGFIQVQDGVRWTTDIRHFIDSSLSHSGQIHDANHSAPPTGIHLVHFIHFILLLSWDTTSKTDCKSHLISMQQYANALDLLVSVCFISPGFFLRAMLKRSPSLHPIFLSWQHLHTDKLGELLYSTVDHGASCVPCSCARFCRYVHHIDLLSVR